MTIQTSYRYFCFQQLHAITQRKFNYYYEIQLFLFATFSFIGTSTLLSIHPERSITFSALYYGSSLLLQQGIKQIPWSKENKVLFRIEQIIHFSSAIMISKITSHLLIESLSLFQCIQVIGMFLIAYHVFLVTYRYFSNYFNPFKKDLVHS